MLVISRKLEDAIELTAPQGVENSARITIKVVGVVGRTVKIGIEAPRDIAVKWKNLNTKPAVPEIKGVN